MYEVEGSKAKQEVDQRWPGKRLC